MKPKKPTPRRCPTCNERHDPRLTCLAAWLERVETPAREVVAMRRTIARIAEGSLRRTGKLGRRPVEEPLRAIGE